MRNALRVGCVFGVGFVMWSCGGSGYGPAGPSPPPAGGPGAGTINITGNLGNQSFSPNPASIGQGDTVMWHNTDSTVHRIVLNDGSLDTGNIAAGASSAALRLGTDGANYHCTIHPGMIGSIRASTGQPPPCVGQYCQ